MTAAAKTPNSAEFSEPKARPARRINVRCLSERTLDRHIFGLSVPSISVLLRGYYGPGWAKVLSRKYGVTTRVIYNCVNGNAALPRYFLQDIVDEWNDAGARAAWEREERAAFERQLKRRIERRVTLARWAWLLLSGAAALPSVNWFRKFGYAGMERNFLGSGDK